MYQAQAMEVTTNVKSDLSLHGLIEKLQHAGYIAAEYILL